MANLNVSDGRFDQTFTIGKQSGSYIELPTANKYLDKNIKLSFDVATATLSYTAGTITGGGINTNNITTTSTNNGISIQRATMSIQAKYDSTTSGYVSAVENSEAGTISGIAASSTSYIAGVTLEPGDTTRTFSITVPNGDNDTITFTFKVAPNREVWVEES